MSLVTEDTERELNELVAAYFASQGVLTFGGSAGISSLQGQGQTFSFQPQTSFDRAFMAGKIASHSGVDAIRRMSTRQLTRVLEQAPNTITSVDEAVLEQLKRNSSRTLSNLFQNVSRGIAQAISRANDRWQSALANASPDFPPVRQEFLRALRFEVEDLLESTTSQSQRIVQTELALYQQQGAITGAPRDEMLYKIPRPTAEAQCLRLHLNADGSPKLYKLSDVAGNSNRGLPPSAWQFVIGPVHPFCMCILHRVGVDGDPPGANRSFADKRAGVAEAAGVAVTTLELSTTNVAIATKCCQSPREMPEFEQKLDDLGK